MGSSKDPSVELSEEILLAYSGPRQQWVQEGVEDEDFRHGAQWDETEAQELKLRKQPALSINKIHPAVESLKAALTSNPPKFTSVGREGSDLRLGAAFAEIMSYIWDRSLGQVQLKTGVEDFCTKGMKVDMAYVDSNADNGRAELCFSSLNPHEVYFDPNSKDQFCRDSANIIIEKILTDDQIVTNWPQYADLLSSAEEWSGATTGGQIVSRRHGGESQASSQVVMDMYHRRRQLLDRYTKVKSQKFLVSDPVEGWERVMDAKEYVAYLKEPAFVEVTQKQRPRFFTGGASVAAVSKVFEQWGGVFHYAMNPSDPSGTPVRIPGEENAEQDAQLGVQTVPGSTVHLAKIDQRSMVEHSVVLVQRILVDRIERVFSIGGVLAYKGEMPLSEYPIIPTMFRHRRNPYPMSPVRFVRPLQEYINKVRSLIIAHAANSTNVKILVNRGSIDTKTFTKEWQKAGTAVLEIDMEVAEPVVVGPIPLPNELYKNEADAARDIQEIFGIYSLSQGDPMQAPPTYKGTVALDEYMQRRTKSIKDDIEEGLNQLARVIVELIPAVYTEQKVLRIIRPNNSPITLEINKPVYDDLSGDIIGKLNDVSVGKYDIVCISGSMLPVNRWARLEYYQQLYKEGIIDREEVLKQTEVVDTEGVLKRMNEIDQLKQVIQSLSEQLKGVKGDLQTAQRESVLARQRVEVEKFKSDLNSNSAKAEMATQLFQARLGDEIKNAKLKSKKTNQK